MMRGGRGRGSGGRGRRSSTDRPSSRGKGSKGSTSGSKSNSQSQGLNAQGPGVSADLNPVLPPIYPPIGKLRPMNETLASLAPNLLNLTQYFKSNYSIPIRKGKIQSAFHVDRYSDRYNEPMTIDPHLQHTPNDKRLPPELLTKGISRNSGAEFEAAMARKRKCMEYNLQRKMQELAHKAEQEDNEDFIIEEVDLASSSDDEGEIRPVKIKREDKSIKDEDKPPEDDEEEPDEMEEELDAGTDYMANYFDNGEDYLDEEDDNLDDNAVY